MNELTFDDMLGLMCQHLATTPEDKGAFTLLLGAGFSYGVIPTAREILTVAPNWLYRRQHDLTREEGPSDRIEIARDFWGRVEAGCGQEGQGGKFQYDEETGLPTNEWTAEAYKLLMSVHCPGGLTTPVLRRDFMRYLCSNAVRKNNPAHLFLACLLNHQRKHDWKYRGRFCKTILTTNFDHLLQHALQLVNVLYYMSDRPEVLDHLVEDVHDAIHLVYTHGSVHRYRLLNSTDEIEDGRKNSSSLRSHFERHGVIVIGYGGWADATMSALRKAHQFDGNLYWCVRRGDYVPEAVHDLLEKQAPCAFKVTIPDADEAMHYMFEAMTGLSIPELLEDPISLITDQLDGLHFSESETPQKTERPEYIHSFDTHVENSLARLRVARQAYIDPENYQAEDGTYVDVGNSDQVSLGTPAEIKAKAMTSKYVAEAIQLAEANKLEEAIECWNKVLATPDISARQKASTLINRGTTYGALEPPRIEEQLADYSTVIGMSDATPKEKAWALYFRGLRYGRLEPPHREEQLADYTAIITMSDASPVQRVQALMSRATTYGKLEPPRREEQLADYTTIITMPDATPAQRAQALMSRAITYGKLEPPRREKELADYSAVVAMTGAPPEEKARALRYRAVTYGELTPPRREEELADYSAVITMADAPPEEKARALRYRALTYGELRPPRRQEQLADYSAIIAMPSVSARQKAQALNGRAIVYGKFEPPRTEEQISDYSAVIAIPDAPAKEIAIAHGHLGLLAFDAHGDAQTLLERSRKAIEYEDDYAWRYNVGLATLFLGTPNEALMSCLPAIPECTDVWQIDDALERLKAKRSILPEASRDAYDEIVKRLNKRRQRLTAADASGGVVDTKGDSRGVDGTDGIVSL